MSGIKTCKECGVPSLIAKGYAWDSGGTIISKRNAGLRSVIFETEAFNRVFASIEELIGMPIDHLIVESKRRWAREIQEATFPAWMRKLMVLSMDHLTGDNFWGKTVGKPITAVARYFNVKVNDLASAMGLSVITLGGMWERGEKYPHRENIIRNPYSLPLSLGENLGATEGWEQRDMQNRCEEIAKNTYRVTTFEGKHPVELKERLQVKRYPVKPGDITYQRCASCGVPKDISRLEWDYAEGIITDPDQGRRVAFTDAFSLEAVFEDLEAELGEDIQKAIIAGQRLHSRETAETDERLEESRLKKMLALHGLGNLKRFEMEEGRLEATVENTILQLLVVGMLQAAFELGMGAGSSTCVWEVTQAGELNLTLSL